MLHELRIENLALIDKLQLNFSDRKSGLIVFTGETGAGKSIILQAIHLLTGGRGATDWIRTESEQAIIEAYFDFQDSHREIKMLLDEHGLENNGGCIVRRLLTQNGKNRMYVNDRLVTSRIANDLTVNLLTIASQHDNQQLLVSRRHLDLLDSFGELWDYRDKFSELYNRWSQLKARLKRLREQNQEKEQRRDFLIYQLKEIEEAEIVPGEDEALLHQRDRLKSSGILAGLVDSCYNLLNSYICDRFVEIRKNMEQVVALDSDTKNLAERIATIRFELEDIETELLQYRDSIPMDQSMLEEMNSRIALLKQLQRKYGTTLEEVLSYAENIRNELAAFEDTEQEITFLEKEIQDLSEIVVKQADGLSELRSEAALRMEDLMEKELVSLNFHQAVFKVNLKRRSPGEHDGLMSTGREEVEFLFSANPGEDVRPLAKIASGGELSRLMLALKCLLARRDRVDTVIFDEIDAGVGGKAAEAVGIKIRELATHHQVICITHLPQIASSADEHFYVSKLVKDGRTHTEISYLNPEERVLEIARMLAGSSLSKETIAFARDLIDRTVKKSNR